MNNKKMATKRKYKTLTSKQTTQVKKYTKAGMSQKDIARKLGVSKQRVVNAQKSIGIGKRVASEFWQDVETLKELTGFSHKKATAAVKSGKKWGQKRAKRLGKKWKSEEERQATMRQLRQEFEGEELDKRIAEELDDVMYGDTAR